MTSNNLFILINHIVKNVICDLVQGVFETCLSNMHKAVLKHSGIKSVKYNLAFKMVSQALLPPKTCASATFNLWYEYEKLRYVYE